MKYVPNSEPRLMIIFMSFIVSMIASCSDEKEYTEINKVSVERSELQVDGNENNKASDASKSQNNVNPASTGGGGTGSVDAGVEGNINSSDVSTNSPQGTNNTGNNGSDPDKPVDNTPKVDTELLLSNYFEQTISPLMKDSTNPESCVSCHVGPRVEVVNRGPEKVLSDYKYLLSELKNGTSSANNPLINKVKNTVAHGGGNRCPDPEGSPCKEFIEWGKIFYEDSGKDDPTPPVTTFGNIVNTDWDGTIYGYGISPSDSSAIITVELYKDAPFDQGGVLVGEIVANQIGVDGDTPGNHAFKFKIPDGQINSGNEMKLYGYSIIDGEKKPFGTAEYKETWFVPSVAGEAYFTNTVLPALNSCSGCHPQRTLRGAFGMLVDPKPGAGGSAANNFFNRKTGNQITHGGGNRCGGGSPCDVIAAWWNIEFAN